MISKARIKYIKSLALKKNRDADGVFVAEGPKIISDLRGHFELLEEYTGEDADKASLLNTPQGALAIFKKPNHHHSSLELPLDSLSTPLQLPFLILVLDGVQNPGNLGTIVRLADWFGIDDIVCSEDCADIYNPKTVQATMGSMARVRVHYCSLPQFLASLPEGTPVYGTFLDGENIYSTTLSQHGIIVMGNEGHGISAEVAKYVNKRISIPSYPQGAAHGESLNVAIATAVVCAEFRRR